MESWETIRLLEDILEELKAIRRACEELRHLVDLVHYTCEPPELALLEDVLDEEFED